MNPPILSIITAIRNGKPYNELFLESLKKYTHHSFELIIIDNHSTDGSDKLFLEHGANVLRPEEPLCYGCSQNLGLSKATGSYVAFLNNDIYLSQNWDKKLIDYLEAYNLEIISPCGNETKEDIKTIKRSLKRWRYINFIQRVRSIFNIRFKSQDIKALIQLMYGNWDTFCTKRSEQFSNFLYPGISGFALLKKRPNGVLKNAVEKKNMLPPMIAGDVFVHHFIRATFRTDKKPFACSHPIQNILEVFPNPQERMYLKTPSVSIIIAVYNRAEVLEMVFLSLLRQTFSDFEVVIADDGSTQEIVDTIHKFHNQFKFPIQHIYHEDNGFRKTQIVNKAVMAARAPYLVFIDGDVLLHHRFLERHWKNRLVHRVLSGRRVMYDEARSESVLPESVSSGEYEQRSYLKGCTEQNSERFHLYMPIIARIERLLKKKYWILGSNFSCYKGDYLAINGYDEDLVGRGLEDNHLSALFNNAGYYIKSVTREALQYHLFHRSKPIAHSQEIIDRFGNTKNARSDNGILKKDRICSKLN